MKPVMLHEEAEAELREALERVRENPLLYASEDDDGIRACPLRRFPYTLVFVDLDDHIWIAALAHQRRRPRYWAKRRPE